MLLDGRRSETSQFQARDIESQDTPVATASQVKTQSTVDDSKDNSKGQNCTNCGGKVPHKGLCPAKGKQCNKLNHFANSKLKTEVTQVDQRIIFILLKKSSSSQRTQTPKTKVTVGGHTFAITVDTGASINVMDQETFSKLKGISLHKTNVKAYTYNATKPVRFLGKFDALIETRKKYTTCTFYVIADHKSGCLLSSQTAQDLGLVSLHLNEIQKKVSVKTDDEAVQKIVNKHPEVFNGVGKLKGHSVTLNIDPEVIPHAQPQRRIPFHIDYHVSRRSDAFFLIASEMDINMH